MTRWFWLAARCRGPECIACGKRVRHGEQTVLYRGCVWHDECALRR